MVASAAALDGTRLAEVLTEQRAKGRRVALAVGVFELLHPGHVDLFRAALEHADCLVVGVYDDAVVASLEGPGHPHIPLSERLEIIAALRGVDFAVAVDRQVPAGLIEAVRPDVMITVRGHLARALAASDFFSRCDSMLVEHPRLVGHSTAGLLDRIRRLPGPRSK